MSRYFYHSFPRRGRNADAEHSLGLRVLESIVRDGLLLTPEEVSWRDPLLPDSDHRVTAYQLRACFTELAPEELAAHAANFGAFSLEFEIQALRALGAMPVFYVPDDVGAEPSLAIVPTAIMAHVAATSEALNAMALLLGLPERNFELDVRNSTGEIETHRFAGHEIAVIQRFIRLLETYQHAPVSQTAQAFKLLGCMFYPTENLEFNNLLDYYRQREWRLFPEILFDGVPSSRPASADQITRLNEIDPTYFSRVIDHPTGARTRGEACHFVSQVLGRPLSAYVRRIVVPTGLTERVMEVLERNSFPATVVEGA